MFIIQLLTPAVLDYHRAININREDIPWRNVNVSTLLYKQALSLEQPSTLMGAQIGALYQVQDPCNSIPTRVIQGSAKTPD